MKRFYKTAEAAACGGGYVVLLDGRPLRTPAKRPLEVPWLDLARAAAREWARQEDIVRPDSMPITGLVSTKIDRIGDARAEIVDTVAGYAETDLLCYRAEEPAELRARQAEAWDPLVAWAAVRFDAPLRVTSGVMPVRQDRRAVEALRGEVAALDDWRLTGLQAATPVLGSLVLALAMVEDHREADAAFELAHLDEMFQAERWGEDGLAARRRDALRRELRAVARYLALCRPSDDPTD